eukprot:CAMPEP_0114238646 /NCGR_PEP_ID=MMETSP0058-20121206/8032_1 /TAXON_ID=36894 /ORGANISM="Pyramimonas parkeae, CCMP726" /LENGTH=653 /DNA_ID=CAMNT_0001350763 /DNA_START=13 /DNA_END=1971 /DNA_ORIENTATION=-
MMPVSSSSRLQRTTNSVVEEQHRDSNPITTMSVFMKLPSIQRESQSSRMPNRLTVDTCSTQHNCQQKKAPPCVNLKHLLRKEHAVDHSQMSPCTPAHCANIFQSSTHIEQPLVTIAGPSRGSCRFAYHSPPTNKPLASSPLVVARGSCTEIQNTASSLHVRGTEAASSTENKQGTDVYLKHDMHTNHVSHDNKTNRMLHGFRNTEALPASPATFFRPFSSHTELANQQDSTETATKNCSTSRVRQSLDAAAASQSRSCIPSIPSPSSCRASLDRDRLMGCLVPNTHGNIISSLYEPPLALHTAGTSGLLKEKGSRAGRSLLMDQHPSASWIENTFESRHAWYVQPWGCTWGNQGGAHARLRGPTIQDFDVQCEIGEGQASKVYLARIRGAKLLAPEKDDRVVLKAMRKEEVLDDESLVKDSAKEEIRMLTSLQSSRHVIRLLGTFESTTHVYMAMEWAPCDFFQLMTDHFASHRYWCNIHIYAAQVLMALEDLHRTGLVYCDLKPENLLVCVDGSVKLADLGLAARFPKEGKGLTRICGTPEYMSPEMLTQSSSLGYNHMTDLWSYGIFVHEILTGTVPFTRKRGDNSTMELFNKIRRHTAIDVKIQFEVTNEAKSLILGLLTRNPKERLGCHDIPGAYNSIRQHAWFSNLNW